ALLAGRPGRLGHGSDQRGPEAVGRQAANRPPTLLVPCPLSFALLPEDGGRRILADRWCRSTGPVHGRTSPPLRALRRATPGAQRLPAAMGQAGPALIVTMPSPVTPCGGSPHPTVLDPRDPADLSAANCGDVCGSDEVPVPPESTVRAGDAPAPRLGDPPPAEQTRRGGPPLVHLDHPDARQGRLVFQGADQMGTPPVAQPEVLSPAYAPVADALWV